MKKEIRINVRTTNEIKRDLKTTARLRGLNESALVNLLVVRAIREEKTVSPEEFVVESKVRTGSQSGLSDDVEEGRKWQAGLRNAKGLWKGRDDLPDLRQLRQEAERSDQWNKDK